MRISSIISVALMLMGNSAFGQNTPSACEHLKDVAMPGVHTISAQAVAAGTFTPPSSTPLNPNQLKFYQGLPGFCRIVAQATPSADSDIRIEVWLPLTKWNGKFQGQGNGGFAGYMPYNALGAAIRQGYATAGTDTGHTGEWADWALGHPEKVADYGYRAVHEMTRVGKAWVKSFYGSDAQRSYFAACSNGGRQALMEAQRYPADYDGILAGAPANYFTHLITLGLAIVQATADEASRIPASKLPAIASAVVAACDKQDGVADGILNDPRQCHFDPATLLCKAGLSDDGCLTLPQVTTLKKIYSGLQDGQGRTLFPGELPGAELGPNGWGQWLLDSPKERSAAYSFTDAFFRNIVYEKPDWNFRNVTVSDAMRLADQKTGAVLNAVDPDLTQFRARGGKLILYHGWNDPGIPALSTIDYYDSVVKRMGAPAVNSFMRLFMVAGMQHCGGGLGAITFGQLGREQAATPQQNIYVALEQWVEQGIAPSRIIARGYVPDDPKHTTMTRPLCPYPALPQYKGTGDSNDAANFACVPHP